MAFNPRRPCPDMGMPQRVHPLRRRAARGGFMGQQQADFEDFADGPAIRNPFGGANRRNRAGPSPGFGGGRNGFGADPSHNFGFDDDDFDGDFTDSEDEGGFGFGAHGLPNPMPGAGPGGFGARRRPQPMQGGMPAGFAPRRGQPPMQGGRMNGYQPRRFPVGAMPEDMDAGPAGFGPRRAGAGAMPFGASPMDNPAAAGFGARRRPRGPAFGGFEGGPSVGAFQGDPFGDAFGGGPQMPQMRPRQGRHPQGFGMGGDPFAPQGGPRGPGGRRRTMPGMGGPGGFFG